MDMNTVENLIDIVIGVLGLLTNDQVRKAPGKQLAKATRYLNKLRNELVVAIHLHRDPDASPSSEPSEHESTSEAAPQDPVVLP